MAISIKYHKDHEELQEKLIYESLVLNHPHTDSSRTHILYPKMDVLKESKYIANIDVTVSHENSIDCIHR